MSKRCIICGKRAYSDYCFKHKPQKRIRRIGKQAKKWQETRAEYLKTQPEITYCYLCNKLLDKNNITIDHVVPRSRRPDLRHDFNNLKPCCWFCNSKKGSKVIK